MQIGDLFPNPSDNFRSSINISVPQESEAVSSLFLPTGRQVFEQKDFLPKGRTTLEYRFGELPAGMYWMKIVVGEEVFGKRLVLVD